MSKHKVIDSLTGIDDDMIEAVAVLRSKKRHPLWIKWGALAACLCLLVGIVIPVLQHKGGPGSQNSTDDFPAVAALLYFNGALYECCDVPQSLNRLGLPEEITAEMAGGHVANIELGGRVDYQETASQTDKALFQYAPAPSRAVYVLRDGDNYMAAVFCRTYFPDDPTAYCDLAEVYRFYGIEDARDIASIAQVDQNREKVMGSEITGADAISRFYTLTTDIIHFVSMDNDAFQARLFSNVPEENAQKAYNDFADDLHVLRIKTADGLCFFVEVYPGYGYLYSSGAMAYHQITPELSEWFSDNFGL